MNETWIIKTPVVITPYNEQPIGNNHGGGYINSNGEWGPSDRPRRGEGGASTKHDTRNEPASKVLSEEYASSQKIIEAETKARLNGLSNVVEEQLQAARQAAKRAQPLSSSDAASIDQAVILDMISTKHNNYVNLIPEAYALYGHNPFFLMRELTYKKFTDALKDFKHDSSTLINAFAFLDKTYGSAQELKILSLSMKILSRQLDSLAIKRNETEAVSAGNEATWKTSLNNRLSTINQEKDIHIQLLPTFLQQEVSAATESIQGISPVPALSHHKTVLDAMIASKQASAGGYARANPNITSPLSKPELEALNNLVKLQATRQLGQRWADYHASLLNTESAKHLSETSDALGRLLVRAQEIAAQQAQIPLSPEEETWAAIRNWSIKYDARRNSITNQHNIDKSTIEQRLKSEIDAAAAIAQPVSTSMEFVDGVISFYNRMIEKRRVEAQPYQEILSKYPYTDFKHSNLKDFLERSRDNNLSPDISFEEELSAINAAYRDDVLLDEIKNLQARLPALYTVKAQLDPTAEALDLNSALNFASEVNKEILTRYGTKLGTVTQDLQKNITGKKIRSYHQALETFEKIIINPKLKLTQKDTAAIESALRALDAKTFSDNVKRLGKAFGVVGLSIQGYNVTNKAIAGFKTGNWNPFLLELESIAVGAAAGTVVGPVAGAIMATLLSLLMAPWLATSAAVIAGAISMAAASAYFSPGKVDEINNIIYDSLQ